MLLRVAGGASCTELAVVATVGGVSGTAYVPLVRLGGHLAGIFTERDYLTKVAVYDDASAKELPVAAVMTPGDTVRSVPSSKPVADWDFVSPNAVVDEYLENMYRLVSSL